MTPRRRRPADRSPLERDLRALFHARLRLFVPEAKPDQHEELDALLDELRQRPAVDFRRAWLALRAGAFAAAIERRNAAHLTEFRDWQRRKQTFLSTVARLRPQIDALYARLPHFFAALEKAGRLPVDDRALPTAADRTLDAIEQLQAAVQADLALQITGGRADGNQPALAAATCRAHLRAAGLPGPVISRLLALYGISRPPQRSRLN